MDGPTASSVEVAGAPTPDTASPLGLRVLGVVTAAALGVGTFATLGFALAQVLYDEASSATPVTRRWRSSPS
jgi:hypothetical protein